MTTRLLPPAEWSRLAETDPAGAELWPCLDRGKTQVLVVEHEGAILGCWLLMFLPHAECLWIAPEHRRRAAVGRRLWDGMKRLVRDAAYEKVIVGSMTDDVRALHAHLGNVRISAEQYLMDFKES